MSATGETQTPMLSPLNLPPIAKISELDALGQHELANTVISDNVSSVVASNARDNIDACERNFTDFGNSMDLSVILADPTVVNDDDDDMLKYFLSHDLMNFDERHISQRESDDSSTGNHLLQPIDSSMRDISTECSSDFMHGSNLCAEANQNGGPESNETAAEPNDLFFRELSFMHDMSMTQPLNPLGSNDYFVPSTESFFSNPIGSFDHAASQQDSTNGEEMNGDKEHVQDRSSDNGSYAFPISSMPFPFSMTTSPIMGAFNSSPSVLMGMGMLMSNQGFGGMQNGQESFQDERRQKRLARNRESARQSRRRKKQYLELLEEKVTQLTEELEGLRSLRLEESNSQLISLRNKLLLSLQGKIDAIVDTENHDSIEIELSQGVRDLLLQLGPSCDQRLAVVAYHFDQLQSLILPSYSRFILWLSTQPEDFFCGNSGSKTGSHKNAGMNNRSSMSMSNELWSLLCKELGLTADQESKIKMCQKAIAQDPVLRQNRHVPLQLMRLLSDLQSAVESYMSIIQERMENIASSLYPSQVIRYLGWVHHNQEAISHHHSQVLQNTLFNETNANADEQFSESNRAPVYTTSWEVTEVKLMRLLEMPDSELSMDDMIWLMGWVKGSRARRGQPPLSGKPSCKSKDILNEAIVKTEEVCMTAKAIHEANQNHVHQSAGDSFHENDEEHDGNQDIVLEQYPSPAFHSRMI